jgi:glycosyltransferase involved in cell wall biosynthesis
MVSMNSPAAAAERLAKRSLRRLFGRLHLMELRNKVLLAPTGRALKRIEDAEVSRLLAEIGGPRRALVATIIPTFRRPELLRCAIESAFLQTITDQVVVVVDDGGGLPDVLPLDPRLVAVSLSANVATAGVVRNVGLRLTESDYVAFLDDDNTWEPNHLGVAITALDRHRASLVYTALRRSLSDGRPRDVLSVPFDRRRLADEAYVDTNAVVARRVRGLRFSRLHRAPQVLPREDWELVFRLSRRHRVVHIPVPTVRYLVNPESHWSDWSEAV